MEQKDVRIDEYIAGSAPFAQPVLNHLRKLIHEACPDVAEKIKWSFPHFDYKGVFCSMAAFKEHCAFNFWKANLIPDPHNLLKENSMRAMGQFGRIKSLKDLPDDLIILQYLKEAMKLNETGIKSTWRKSTEQEKKELAIPDELIAALKKNKKAKETFDRFTYSHRKEYVEWIREAKTEATRIKRVETSVEWLSEGKTRNWKYQR
jgi:uncharacterized protein YdeI (YjbR/CyaY-like superfamily)